LPSVFTSSDLNSLYSTGQKYLSKFVGIGVNIFESAIVFKVLISLNISKVDGFVDKKYIKNNNKNTSIIFKFILL
jgi:hypothetical protein